jgi:hypothetical protein
MDMYNGLVKLSYQCRESWVYVGMELKRRYDLISSLVETVKGSARHEHEAVEEVAQKNGGKCRHHLACNRWCNRRFRVASPVFLF